MNITWREAFARSSKSAEFQGYFRKGNRPVLESDFRPATYAKKFPSVAAGTVAGAGAPTAAITPGSALGPESQPFPQGAVILAITASATQAQTTTNDFQYAPSYDPGRRDLFALAFTYSGDEQLTPGGPVMASALLGGGSGTIYPSREIIVPPSQTITCTVQAFCIEPDLTVHVCYHCVVPRVVS